MENLEYGWKKAVRQYHYFVNGGFVSLCSHATYYKSDLKQIEFFSEIEITADMSICPSCKNLRKSDMKTIILEEYKKSKSESQWNNSHVCPNCKTPVMFWDGKKSKEHPCTVCNEMVVLP